jgi:hypothetical protein
MAEKMRAAGVSAPGGHRDRQSSQRSLPNPKQASRQPPAVYLGRAAIGTIQPLASGQFVARDINSRKLGLFSTVRDAAAAVLGRAQLKTGEPV